MGEMLGYIIFVLTSSDALCKRKMEKGDVQGNSLAEASNSVYFLRLELTATEF